MRTIEGNNMKSKKFAIILLLIAASAAFTVTWRCFHHWSMVCNTGGSVVPARWDNVLGLTSEQKLALDNLDADTSAELNHNEVKIADLRIAASNALRKNSVRQQELTEFARKIGDLQTQNEELMFAHCLKMKQFLTSRQTDIFVNTLTNDICKGCGHQTEGCRMRTGCNPGGSRSYSKEQ
jgi:hypothetical protein